MELYELWDEVFASYVNESNWRSKIAILQNALMRSDNRYSDSAYRYERKIYSLISKCYCELGEYQKALVYNTKVLNVVDPFVPKDDDYFLPPFYDSDVSDVCYQRICIYRKLYKRPWENLDVLPTLRTCSLYAARYLGNDLRPELIRRHSSDTDDASYTGNCLFHKNDDFLMMREDAEKVFRESDESYTKHFHELSQKDRKVLLIVDNIQDLNQKHLAILQRPSNLTNLSFPIGHPKVNVLYVAHPLVTNRYLPIENYRLELIEDKVREFCELAQHLGATEINIECLNSSAKDSTNSGSRDIYGGVSKGSVRVGGSYHDEYSRRLIEKISRSICLHQTLHPHKAPKLPDNLIWYNSEPKWQRLYRQRMEGSLLTHEERIDMSKIRVVDNHEMMGIKTELEMQHVNINIGFDKTEESRLEQEENAVLAISVRFAPLSELTGSSAAQNSQNVCLSANERKYIEEVKECLADGEIGKTARKLLNMTREQLGISETRAAELEAFVAAPQLTEEEKDYLETYREACADGKISDGERRMLDRYRSKLGISESRAKEIERMA